MASQQMCRGIPSKPQQQFNGTQQIHNIHYNMPRQICSSN